MMWLPEMTGDWTHWSSSTALILTGVFQSLSVVLLPGQNSLCGTLAVFMVWGRRNKTDNFMRHFSSSHHVPLWPKTSRVVASSSFFTAKCALLQHWCVSLEVCSLGRCKSVGTFLHCLTPSSANDITSSRLAQISFSDDFPHTFLRKTEVSSLLFHCHGYTFPILACSEYDIPSPAPLTWVSRASCLSAPSLAQVSSCSGEHLWTSRIPREPVTTCFHYIVLHRAYQAC